MRNVQTNLEVMQSTQSAKKALLIVRFFFFSKLLWIGHSSAFNSFLVELTERRVLLKS